MIVGPGMEIVSAKEVFDRGTSCSRNRCLGPMSQIAITWRRAGPFEKDSGLSRSASKNVLRLKTNKSASHNILSATNSYA